MKNPLLFTLLAALTLPTANAGETAAEPIRAMNLCDQAVAREQARPNPEYYADSCVTEVRPPEFWRCVLKAMDQDRSLSFSIDLCTSLQNQGPTR